MNTFAEKFESLMEQKQVRIAGLVVAVLVLAISAGLLVAAKTPSKPLVLKPVLPETAPALTVVRWLPDGDRRAEALQAMFPTPFAKVSGASAQGRGKVVLSRR
ncbi:MAG: hypothetical protein SFW67_06585 [Myxococcaceae bacterium]|nr:hypothetical protein [Myxococcaceae bacterium]